MTTAPPTGPATGDAPAQGWPSSFRRRPWLSARLAERTVIIGLGLVALAGLVIARVWPVSSVDSGQATCLVRLATGVPCPGCGMTRSWVHLAHGDVAGAFAYHLMGPVLFAAAAALAVWVITCLVRRRPPERLFDLLQPRWLTVVLGVWLGYSALRIVSVAMGQDTFAFVV